MTCGAGRSFLVQRVASFYASTHDADCWVRVRGRCLEGGGRRHVRAPSSTDGHAHVTQRQQWKSNLGFILAAAGSAIGLGNIVFFSANAYRFGAGAFYLPYLFALLVCGVPVMMVEFGLGKRFQASFPIALGRIGGRFGEVVGWFAILNALMITMYYSTILAWTAGMWWLSITGSLFEASVAVPAFGLEEGAMDNPGASFFRMTSSWAVVVAVLCVWAMNYFSLARGTKSIEAVVRVVVPFIWVVMILFIVRGMTLAGGIHGAFLLFKPEFGVMLSPRIWNGAFSQIFFTLSLGFGIMTAYASYLPRDTDHVSNAFVVSLMNCAFEMIAGLAIFSLLFAFAIVPQASTLGMMFFVVPAAIGSLPVATQLLGAGFFTLLMAAGITSSISLVESALAALADKFEGTRRRQLLIVTFVGILGSTAFALPHVIDSGLNSNGTLGLSLLDLVDHYTFSYGLLIVGLIECLLVGWLMPIKALREELNASSSIRLGPWFDYLVRYVIPTVLLSILISTVLSDIGVLGSERFPTVYGQGMELGAFHFLPWLVPVVWAGLTLGLALHFASRPMRKAAVLDSSSA